MRRLHSLAILGAVILLSLSAQAQRGMGGRSAGGPSMGGRSAGGRSFAGPSMSGRSAGGRGFVAPARVGPAVSPARISPARRGAARTVSPSRRVIIAGGFNRVHPPFGFNGRCFGGFPCRNQFFFHNPFFFGAGLGFGLGVPFYPYAYGSGFDPNYYPSSAQPAAAPADDGGSSDVQLAVEIQRLSDEVESMREESRQASLVRASGSSLSPRQPAEAATFVFRDGHRISSQNYAIAGQTIWLLNEHMAKKVALTDIDTTATEQANAANGIDLHLPSSH